MATTQYEIPAHGLGGDYLHGWLMEAVAEGDGWLKAQRPSLEWAGVLDMLGSKPASAEVKGLSNTGYNLVERNARDIVASLSNFRHEGEFRPRFDKQLYNQAHTITKLDRNWYIETNAYNEHRSNLQNAVCFGTGYLVEDFDKGYWGTHGDIRLRPFGPEDVTFVQLPKNHDIQQAYMVIIREELPINLAKAQYKNIASALTPDREAPGWLMKGLRKMQSLMGGSPALRVGGPAQRKQEGSFPTVDIYHAYVVDRSINLSGAPVVMGSHDTNWSYNVPALGDPMPTGLTNPATGQEWTRAADENDCKLFPLRRYCIFSRTAVSYDGSSPWWHGQTPVARMRFNDWAWEALGKSLLSDARTMQDGIVALMRCIEDASAARLDPPCIYDDQLTSEGFAKAFNPRMAGTRAAGNLQQGDLLKFPVPWQHYDVPAGIYEWIKSQEQRINHQMGTPDLVAIAKAKQVPGEGTLEKLMEMAGPLVQDMVRALEQPLHQLGNWRLAYYLQFYTRGRIIQVTGPDQNEEDWEFKPDMLIDHREGEPLVMKQERTRKLISQFKYHLTESGINEMHRMVTRLSLLQLVKSGVPVDWWTIARAWQIPNYGAEPEGTNTVMERWLAQQHMQRELAEEMGAGQQQTGRPPTNRKPPQIVGKDNNSRHTVKTS